MTELAATPALLRSLKRFEARSHCAASLAFEVGERTRPVTRAYERQALSTTVNKAVLTVRRSRRTSDERKKDIIRRRKWAGGGTMPDGVRATYSEAERAAMAVVADCCKRKGFCDLCLDEIARLAGVSRTSVQNAIRKGRDPRHGHISVRERPQPGGKSLTNVIRIVCRVWLGWIARGIGFKRLNTSETGVKKPLLEGVAPSISAFENRHAERLPASLHAERVDLSAWAKPEVSALFDLPRTKFGWRR